MAAKRVSLKLPTPIEVGNVDVEFEVRDGAALMGTVTVSRGGLDWRATGRRSAVSVTWKAFAELMAGGSAAPARGRGGATSRNAPRSRAARGHRPGNTAQPSSANADAVTVRSWARDNGYDVNARGAISAAVRDAYHAGNLS